MKWSVGERRTLRNGGRTGIIRGRRVPVKGGRRSEILPGMEMGRHRRECHTTTVTVVLDF